MSKKFQLYIRNNGTGPFKIPFKKGTPKELQAKVDGIILVGKKTIIPSDVTPFVDMEVIANFAARSIVKYKVREVLEIPSKTSPIKKKKVEKVKEEIKTEKKFEKKIDKKGGN